MTSIERIVMKSLAKKCTVAFSGAALAVLSIAPAQAAFTGGLTGTPSAPASQGTFAPTEPIPMTIWDVAHARIGIYEDINQVRAQHGLKPVTYSNTLSWTSNNCLGQIFQSPYQLDRPCYNFTSPMVQGYTGAGQSVIRAAQIDEVVPKLMATPSGRAKILDPNLTHVGSSMGYLAPGDKRFVITFASYSENTVFPQDDSNLPRTSWAG